MHNIFIKRKSIRIIGLLIVAIILIIYLMSGQGSVSVKLRNKNFITQLLSDAMPVFYKFNHIDYAMIERCVLGFNLNSPMSIIQSNVFAFTSLEVTEEPMEEEPVVDLSNAKPIKETTISYQNSKGYYEADGVLVKNQTTYNFNPVALLNEPLKFDFKGKGPHILIVHSHSSESYTATDKNYYLPTDPDRTEDINYNVVRVGTEIVNALKNNGIEALHDTSLMGRIKVHLHQCRNT